MKSMDCINLTQAKWCGSMKIYFHGFGGLGNYPNKQKMHKQLLTEWYELVQSESQLLFDRTRENAIKYFKLIAADKENTGALDDAMDDFYDEIYDDAFDDYYDAVYDDLMDDVYDTYYDDIVGDGYDSGPYKEWSDESSACYKEWSETSSTVYKIWSEANSATYKLWSAVSSGFYQKNFDIDEIVKELEEKTEESQSPENTEQAENTNHQDTGINAAEVNPELVAFLDEYEAFMDEYVEFMIEYKNAKDVSGMLSDYAEIMVEYVDFANALEQYDPDEMSPVDAAYLLEVSARISQKMLEAAY